MAASAHRRSGLASAVMDSASDPLGLCRLPAILDTAWLGRVAGPGSVACARNVWPTPAISTSVVGP